MKARVGSFSLDAQPDRVFDYFSVPRNLVMANNPGPVVDRSVPATGAGSWAVLKFDQLRMRVEYEVWERPVKLAGVVRYTGLGSGNRVDRFSYELEATGDGTVLRYEIAGGYWLTLPFIGEWLERRYWLNVQRRIKAGASDIRQQRARRSDGTPMTTADDTDRRTPDPVPKAAPMPSRVSRPARSFGFVLAVPIGILVLWVAGLGALLLVGGDCFGTDAECRAIWKAQVVQGQVLEAIVGGLTVLGFLAVAVGRVFLPAALLVASVATLFVGFAADPLALWWVPRGIGFVMLPAAVMALASAGQIIERIQWRPRWLRTWLGE